MTKDTATPIAGDLISMAADIAALIAIGEARAFPEPRRNDDGSVTHFHAKDIVHYDVPALNPTLPEFVKQAEQMVEPVSFMDYVRTFKSARAIAKASLSQNSIVAVLDYHGQARSGDDDTATPGRCEHTVRLLCPYDLDYAKWKKVFGNGLKQAELAYFLEDMIHTIAEPAAADLLEAINNLKIDRSVKFKSGRNDRNGTVQIQYEEVDDEKGTREDGQITLPQEIKIVVPIFQGAVAVQLTAKLRYQLDRGQIAFILAVPGLDNEERIAFRSIAERVRQETDTPVYYTA